MRHSSWFLAMWLLAASCAAKAEDISYLAGEETAFERIVREVMERHISPAFEDVSLADLMNDFERETGILFRFDHKALADAGVGSDTTVSLSLDNVRVRTALRLVLDDLDLNWVIRGDVILITTKSEAENILATRVYDVDDLVVVPGGANYEVLIDVLTSNLAPASWNEAGGPGTVRECQLPGIHALIVTQTQEVHEQIAELLAALRRVRRTRPAERSSEPTALAVPRSTPKAPQQRARAYATAPSWTVPQAHE
jgi:hypothetical protein